MTTKTRPAVTTSVEIVTPEMASAWLDTNHANRRLRRTFVTQLARAILRGEWLLNGETIKFDRDGSLLDGQHRLSAIVEADKSIPLTIVRGLDHAAQETVDIGAKRSMADMLKMRGEASATSLASTLRLLVNYEQRETFKFPPEAHPTAQQMFDLLERQPDIRSSIPTGKRVRDSVGIPQSIAGALDYLFGLVHREDADAFVQDLVTGANLSETDPIFALRRYMNGNRGNSQGVSLPVLGALIIKTWNAWQRGDEVRLLTYKPGGKTREPYPSIIGLDATGFVKNG